MNLLEKRLKERFPNEQFEVLTYVKMKERAQVKCLTCGTIYNSIAESYIKKTKVCFCSQCGMADYKQLQYQKKINLKFPNEELQILEYNGAKGPLRVKCLKCKNEYSYDYGENILLKHKQRVCEHCFPNKREALNNTRQKFQFFIENTKLFTNFILPDNIRSETVIQSTCTICGKNNFKTMYDYLKGIGCPCQGNNIKLTNEQYQNRIGDNYKLISDYNGWEAPVLIQHVECGFIYKANAKHISCPRCKGSNGEKEIRGWLKQNNFNFIEQYKMEIQGHNLIFDFYLPEQNLYIEYQGIQHYYPINFFGGEEQFKKQQLYDQYKRDAVGRQLLEISYTDNIPVKLNEYVTKKSSSLAENLLEIRE